MGQAWARGSRTSRPQLIPPTPQNMAWETLLRLPVCCNPPPWPPGSPPGVMEPQPPLPSPVGSAAWARRVPPPAAPPRRPPQSASSLSASRRPPGALETFPRPSPTPCSWPGLWQSPYGPGPPCAGCPLLTAGRGRGPRGHAPTPAGAPASQRP
nr:myocyte-specific enhancer factor 2B-like [Manis javanica]